MVLVTCNRALAQGDFCLLALIFCRKIGNGWKSFNTRTIGTSPAYRSTFLHTTCCGFIYLRPETSYTESIYQHHRWSPPSGEERLMQLIARPAPIVLVLTSPDVRLYKRWAVYCWYIFINLSTTPYPLHISMTKLFTVKPQMLLGVSVHST